MRTAVRWIALVSCVLVAGMAGAREETATKTLDPQQQAAMEVAQRLGSPSEGHRALHPLVGAWTYTAEWRMAPGAEPQTMTGTATNTLVFGDRFLTQEITGSAEGQPPFEGTGFIGYDNIRQEYQSVWFDNMMTGMMIGTGRFDAATSTLIDEGAFSCPFTGEAHRWFRSAWTVMDQDHTRYESYSRTPGGEEFKSMEIHYTRAQ